MKISESILRSTACTLALLLVTQFANAAPSQQQQEAVSAQQTQDAPLPDAPAATAEPQNEETPDAPRQQAALQSEQTAPSQSTSEQQPNPPTQPVGTAAAPYEKPTGIAASRPAGAVIAPGKQRREHAFVIRVAIVVGAAAALGTVVALSRSSSGRP